MVVLSGKRRKKNLKQEVNSFKQKQIDCVGLDENKLG